MHSIKYVHAGAGSPRSHRDGFVAAYRAVFAGAPYFETYTDAQVIEEAWLPHIEGRGIVILALSDDDVVGFGCAMPLRNMSDASRAYLERKQREGAFPCALDSTWYMSELGVRKERRSKDIGYNLVFERLKYIKAIGVDHYVMRTAERNSNSAHMYLKIGAREVLGDPENLAGTHYDTAFDTKSKTRTYHYGSCDVGIAVIEERMRLAR